MSTLFLHSAGKIRILLWIMQILFMQICNLFESNLEKVAQFI